MDLMDASQSKIVILEDAPARAGFLPSVARQTGHVVYTFDKESAFYNNFISIDPDLIIFQSGSPDTVSRLLNILLFVNFNHPVLIFSDSSRVNDLAAIGSDLPASVGSLPCHPGKIKTAIDTAMEKASLGAGKKRPGPILVGNTPEMLRIKKMIASLGYNRDAVLIQGETGTGRELLAIRIHLASNDNEDAFIRVDVPRQISETTGTGQSRYTWNHQQMISDGDRELLKNGGGTIYIKSIDRLPLSLQGTLLHFFQENYPDDIRLIASGETQIDQLVHRGLFRKDLYYRLNVIRIDMPPLRQRKPDIPLLVDYFVTRYCIESGARHFSFSDKTKMVFSKYDWPENVAEMERFLSEKLGAVREDQIIHELSEMTLKNKKKTERGVHLKKITRRVIGRIESEILKLVLEKTNWNRRQAAKTLTISYKSLLNKIKAYNLN